MKFSHNYKLNSGSIYFQIVYGIIFLLSLVANSYNALIFILGITILIQIIDTLGKGIVLRELTAFFSVLICLVLPVIGYEVYNGTDLLARIWVRYMPIDQEKYFSFVLPAVSGFVFTLCFPLLDPFRSDVGLGIRQLLGRTSVTLGKNQFHGIFLIIIGLVTFALIEYLPESFKFLATLVYFVSFAGLMYIYFNESLPFKKLFLWAFILFQIWDSLRTGMFTVVAYMGITLFSFIFLGRSTPFWKKLLAFLLGSILLLTIQAVKPVYRNYTWRGNYQGNKATLFMDLFSTKISDPKSIFSEKAFFPIYYRTNQGYNIALVLRRIPQRQDFDYGVNLSRALFSSFVPRVLWPGKPEAGGKFNMQFYAGVNIRGFSTNVGPVGEAYGSFGHWGGIVFMIFLGFSVRLIYRYFIRLCYSIPLLIFWMPVLFYQLTYSAETDTLQITNSLVKSAFFIWLVYKIWPSVFGIQAPVKNNTIL